jgi:hypothetical protein
MQLKIIFVALFLLTVSGQSYWTNTNTTNNTNSSNYTTNQTYLTFQTIESQREGWWYRNTYNVRRYFAWNSFLVKDGYAYGYYDLDWAISDIFNWMSNYGCVGFSFGNIFALNTTGRIPWVSNCTNLNVEGAIIYEIKDGLIQHATFEKYIISTFSNSSNSTNTTNNTNDTNATWELAMRQFNSWSRKDLWGILGDYDYNSAGIISSENGTQTFQGRWSIQWYINNVLNEIQSCGNAYWQLPVIVNNFIYIRWWRECYGIARSGADTLTVNDYGTISSFVVTSSIVERRGNATGFY